MAKSIGVIGMAAQAGNRDRAGDSIEFSAVSLFKREHFGKTSWGKGRTDPRVASG